MRILAICLALVSAVLLSVGTLLQNGVVGSQSKNTKTSRTHLKLNQLLHLIRKPAWMGGMALTVAAVALHFTALLLAPLILIQPIGAIALVITALLNSRITKTSLNSASIFAIVLCTMGLGAFVVMATTFAAEPDIDDNSLIIILCIAFVLITTFGFIFFSGASKFKPLTFVFGAGVLFGFVATLIKVVMKRLFQQDGFNRMMRLEGELLTDGLTVLALLCLIAAGSLGFWFVQNAYASGPPDLVVAGLTVIDPLIAVSIGVFLLNEAMNAPWPIMLGFTASGAISVAGVLLLSKFHPAVIKESQKALG